MNLRELDISRKLRKITYATDDRIAQILDDHGWRILGKGMEAMVAEKPGSPYVLKLFEHDSEYTLFVNYCGQHVGNPFLPRFSRYVRPVPGTKFSYVRMEKLHAISPEQIVTTYAEYMCALKQMFLEPQEGIVWNHAQDPHTMQQMPLRAGYTDLADCAAQVPELFVKTVQDLLQIMKQHQLYQFDLHYNNVMQRSPGELVITDPFVD